MSEELLDFELPQDRDSIIKVMGVGGGGCNAVNYMYQSGIKDVNFVVVNTDSQALNNSEVPVKIRIGESLTEGRGAGNKPDIGKNAAQENMEDITSVLSDNTKMAFITTGMGGGTGTGAAPEIAKASKEMGILTVGIVTIPFRFEGAKRLDHAVKGVTEISEHVDSLLVIDNEKLREMFGDSSQREAFAKADNILAVAAKGIAEIITVHGHLNVDFADVQTVMTDSGVALMGSADGQGDDRAISAIQNALTSPLLNNNDIKGAKNILLNITSGRKEVTMDEISEINEYVQEAAGYTADLIWGSTIDENLDEKISVTIIATGFETDIIPQLNVGKKNKEVVNLEEPKAQKDTTEQNAQENTNEGENTEFAEQTQKTETSFEDIEIAQKEQYNLNEPAEDEGSEKESASKTVEKLRQYSNGEQKVTPYKPDKYAENLEEMENVPAYVRQGINIQNKKYSKNSEISRYSLYEDSNNRTRISSDNSYLHNNVD